MVISIVKNTFSENKITIFATVFFAAMCAISGCDILTLDIFTLRDSRNYKNAELGFSIKIPRSWGVSEGESGTAMAALAPYDSEADLFRENFNVVAGPLPDGVDIDQYFQMNINEFGRHLLYFQQNIIGDARIAGTKSKWIDYSHQIGSLKLRAVIYMLAKEKKLYIITCTSEIDQFEEYKKIFKAVAKSFKFE